MPTIFSHPAPVLALSLASGSRVISGRLLLAGLICSVLPDVDVAGFFMKISYGQAMGHRGASHSLLFAGSVGMVCALARPWLHCKRWIAFFTGLLAAVSHIALDAATNGGLGVGVFWPWDETRYFLPWRPIEVSPLGIRRFFSARGAEVMLSELTWVWLPCFASGLFIFALRKSLNRMNRINRLTLGSPFTPNQG